MLMFVAKLEKNHPAPTMIPPNTARFLGPTLSSIMPPRKTMTAKKARNVMNGRLLWKDDTFSIDRSASSCSGVSTFSWVT